VLQPGLWLSFGAVSILALAFAGRLGAPGVLATAWRAQWTVTVGLLPFLLILGLPVSFSSPIANLIAVPWVGVAIVPIALLGCLLLPVPWVGSSLLWLAGFLLEILFRILAVIADAIPVWLPVHVPWWGWLLGGLGAFCLLLPAGTPGRLLGGILLLPLFFAPAERVPEGRAHVWMFDVGQGQAVLIRTRDHALVYDAGPRFGDFDLGARVVLPNARALGAHRLDQLLLSHADADHAGGALALHSSMPILRVSSGEPKALPEVLNATPCGGESWRWNGVTFTTWRSPAPSDSNASSCVLRVDANGESLLLTGDVDLATEQRLIESGWNLSAQWLQAAHHGSKTGTGAPFLDAVGPAVALISRGKHNGYGHPHPDVIDRLNAHGVEVLDTAETGAIRIQLGTHGKAILARREHIVFWR
jgi:competence protein ComEC